ncbi:uncharacterized protein GGS22DRAFT_160111 [Annulohypoxylon maeteangense]|uniref:uncharacterized protein n=1 Tax=Annulohypoxylon maeteangense TaxID=1927788 RepID=UPI002007FACA|nr:uncharacterized protein GGS22DRAFT_160111 [Annulohypoxylon maeteangense]KAI0886177.1 hypothetical protein GGS22DRAFT_160111 [Annulohypoxylon maeteangense]
MPHPNWRRPIFPVLDSVPAPTLARAQGSGASRTYDAPQRQPNYTQAARQSFIAPDWIGSQQEQNLTQAQNRILDYALNQNFGYGQDHNFGYGQDQNVADGQDQNVVYDNNQNVGYAQDLNVGYGEDQNLGYVQGQIPVYGQDQNLGYGQDQTQGYPQYVSPQDVWGPGQNQVMPQAQDEQTSHNEQAQVWDPAAVGDAWDGADLYYYEEPENE